jgi:threonylcarbamoyladenosine tRNA methylthiotransferase MtaB
MNRRYDLARYRSVVEAAFLRMPDAAIGCDVMVGFPGEERVDFEEAMTFLASLPLAYLHVFSYSPRPGTASPQLGDPVEVSERKDRSTRMRQLSERLRAAHVRRQIGTEQTVIPEATSGSGWWQGLTGNYVRVRFPWAAADAPGSAVRAVRIERVREGRVEGRLLEPAESGEEVAAGRGASSLVEEESI